MERLVELLQAMELPFAYHHFAEGESPEPPFICYLQENYSMVSFWRIKKLGKKLGRIRGFHRQNQKMTKIFLVF